VAPTERWWITSASPKLIRLRWNQPALRSDNVSAFQVHNQNQVIAYHRWLDSGSDVIVVATLSNSTWWGYSIGFPYPGRWVEAFNSGRKPRSPSRKRSLRKQVLQMISSRLPARMTNQRRKSPRRECHSRDVCSKSMSTIYHLVVYHRPIYRSMSSREGAACAAWVRRPASRALFCGLRFLPQRCHLNSASSRDPFRKPSFARRQWSLQSISETINDAVDRACLPLWQTIFLHPARTSSDGLLTRSCKVLHMESA